MEKITIKQNEDKSFTIEQGNKISYECTWSEMISFLASLTMTEPHSLWMNQNQFYEPKDGEFVYIQVYKNNEFIFIKKTNRFNTLNYACWEVGYPHIAPIINSILPIINTNVLIEEIRPATEEEKQTLLDALRKDGKDWDAENKQIIEYEWKPKNGEEFWFCDDFSVGHLNPYFHPCKGKYVSKANNDNMSYNYRKYFKIDEKEKCQKYCDKLNEAIRNIK